MKLTKKQEVFVKAYIDMYCNVKESCRVAGITRSTFYDWMNRSKAFSEAIRDAEEAALDRAEQRLNEAVDEGNIRAITFLLSTKGRSRGYVNKVEVGGDLLVEVSKWVKEKMI